MARTPLGPAPLLAAFAVALGVNQAVHLPAVSSRLKRDDMARVLEHDRALARRPRADILLLGNSRMHAAVSPAALSAALPGSPSVESLALAGATPTQSLHWLRAWLGRPGSAPTRILVGMAPVDLSARFPAHERAMKFLYGPGDLLRLPPGEALALMDLLLFPAYRYRTEIKDAVKRAPPAPLHTPEREQEHRTLPPGQRGLKDYTESWLPDFQVDPAEVRALRDLVALGRGAGARVTLVRLPVTRDLLVHEQRVAEPAFSGILTSLGTEVLDLAGPDAEARYAFWDCNHLEEASREAFSRDLAAALSKDKP